MNRVHGVCCLIAALTIVPINNSLAAILFESGTLGPTGVPWQDVVDQVVFGENVKNNAYNGVRFELTQPASTTQVGGHFVAPPNSKTTLFAAIVKLDNMSDFPNSDDLSTQDVLGTTLLSVPEVSAEVTGNLNLVLDPGWYALIFGSGRFGAVGGGAALLNNSDIGNPEYIGFLSGFGWGNRLPGKRFVVKGITVPEPTSIILASIVPFFLLFRRSAPLHCRLAKVDGNYLRTSVDT